MPLAARASAAPGAPQAPRGGSYDLLQTVRESASHLRASLLDSLARQREQREATWEQDRSAWLERVREIGDNWRSELGREIQRTRTEIEDAIDISSVRRRAQDIYLSLPCSRSAFPSAGAKMIVDTLKTRAEPLGPLKAAALQRDEDVCAVCLDLMGAGERVIALPSCRHIFHWECLRPWLEKKGADSDCPFCKRSILPELSLDENKWAASVVERQLARESVLQRERAREQEREAEGVLAHLYDAHAQQRSPVASANPAVPTQAHDAAPSPGHASAQSRDAHAGSSERRGAHTHPFPASGIGGAQNHAAEAAHRVPRTAGPAGAGESGGGAGAGIDARHARGLRQQLYLARAVATRQRGTDNAPQNAAAQVSRPHSGTLDIDWEPSSTAGRPLRAAAAIRSLQTSAQEDVPRLRGGMLRRLNTIRRSRAAEGSRRSTTLPIWQTGS